MKIGVYVGSFNPLHLGHLGIANYLSKHYVDKVILIPTPSYWDKQNLVDTEKRIEMLKLIEDDRVIVNSSLSNLKYTYEILRELNKDKLNTYYLIIGSDNLPKLHLWKNWDEIHKNKIIVLKRPGYEYTEYMSKLECEFILVEYTT